MPRYLISSRAIVDIAKNQNLQAQVWLQRYRRARHLSDELYVSSITRVHVISRIDAQIAKRIQLKDESGETVFQMKLMRKNALSLLDALRSEGVIVAMTEEIAQIWSDLAHDKIVYCDGGTLKPISIVEKIELATALNGVNGLDLHYVIASQDAFHSFGSLKIEDLNKV